MKILFLHGLESTPGGSKVRYLQGLGHTILNPLLPRDDFEASLQIAQEEVDLERPDVIVGSSRGGAIAMALDPRGARLVLLAPAWKHYEVPPSAPRDTIVLHCVTDEEVLFRDSEELEELDLIPCGESHRMTDPGALEALGNAVAGKQRRVESVLRSFVRGAINEAVATDRKLDKYTTARGCEETK
jgi:hypothetical protein